MVRAAPALALVLALAAPAVAGPPARVVSMNLCTDQLALMIAAPGQLVAVSWLAHDPALSALAETAAATPAHHGGAEEIYLLRPDLVLAGPWAGRAAVDMLTRLGVRVETIPDAQTIPQMRAAITQMGALLGQPGRAAALLADFDAAWSAVPRGPQGVAAPYGPNGWVAGSQTLASAAIRQAGLTPLAQRLDLPHGGAVPLEALVMAAPDVIVTGARYDRPSQAEALLDHPALAALPARRVAVDGRDWTCAIPQIARAARALAP